MEQGQVEIHQSPSLSLGSKGGDALGVQAVGPVTQADWVSGNKSGTSFPELGHEVGIGCWE